MANTPQLNIRVPIELKEAFIEKAKENGTTATELIIGFMQQYLGIESDRPNASIAVVDSGAIQTQILELEQRLAARIAALEAIQQGKSKRAA